MVNWLIHVVNCSVWIFNRLFIYYGYWLNIIKGCCKYCKQL